MEAAMGERRKSLPRRDARGRFVSGLSAFVSEAPKAPNVEAMLWRFDLTGSCSFDDPWRTDGGRYVIETRRSLKGYPVAMRYDGPLNDSIERYSGVIKYHNAGSWGDLPNGEVAISPMDWMGDPRRGWGNGHWHDRSNKRQLAAIYIHLAHSVNLHKKQCGQRIGILKNYEY